MFPPFSSTVESPSLNLFLLNSNSAFVAGAVPMGARGKQYRSRQSYRTASFIHDRTRIHEIRTKFSRIMMECSVFGPTKAQKLNPSMSLSTIKRRWAKWQEEEKLGVPVDQRMSTYYAYSQNHWNRTFSVEEEKQLADNLHAIIDSRVELVDRAYAREHAIDFFNLLHKDDRTTRSNKKAAFVASNGFVARFKARQDFKRRRPKLVTRIKCYKSKTEMTKRIEGFREQVAKEIKRCGLDMVLNMDETPCRLVEAPATGWSNPGDDQLELQVEVSDKTKISLMPTITASGEKLPMAWINKSKTATPLQTMMNIPKDVFSYYSQKGWVNKEIMCMWLREVILPYTQKRKCALLLDSHESHFHQDVVTLAKKNNVKLIQVPEGTTSLLQPLDVNFNGPWKKARQKLWTSERRGGILHTDNVERTVMRAASAYKNLNAKTISIGWKNSFPDLGDQFMHRHRPRNDG